MDVGGLISFILWLIIVGLIFWLLKWAIDSVAPEPFRRVANVILIVVAVLILIYALVGFLPLHPIGPRPLLR